METLRIDLGLTFWTVCTFLGLLFLLGRYAFQPLKRLLAEREERIRGALEQAAAARRQAAELLERNERQLEEARAEARRIIAEGHNIVARMRRETQESARREAEAIVQQARAEIERQAQRSLEDLRGTVANLSLRIARQVIREGLDEARHERLVAEFIERLKELHGAERRSP